MKKTMFVIGAGKGLGNGVAEKFASEGFRIVLMARNEARLQEYAKEFSDKGYDVQFQVADVADFAAFAESYGKAVEESGVPDVVFYNVGITTPDDKATLSADILVEHYITDVAGAYNCIKLAATDEFAKKQGAILITGGGLAINPIIDYLPLSMDKAALRAMVQAMAPTLSQRNIYLGTVQVTGQIGGSEHFMPAKIAEEFWKLYEKRETNEIIY